MSWNVAQYVARLLHRMTGDDVIVTQETRVHFKVKRWTGSRWADYLEKGQRGMVCGFPRIARKDSL